MQNLGPRCWSLGETLHYPIIHISVYIELEHRLTEGLDLGLLSKQGATEKLVENIVRDGHMNCATVYLCSMWSSQEIEILNALPCLDLYRLSKQ